MSWRGSEKKKPEPESRAPRSSPQPEPQPEKSPGWKGSAPSGTASRPEADRKGWQTSSQQSRSTAWQKPALFTALGVFLILVFVYLILFRPIATPVVVLTVEAYDSPEWPINLSAAEDRERFKSIRGQNLRNLGDAVGSGSLVTALREQLRYVGPGGPDQRAIVVYLSAHGIVEKADGVPTPYLLGAHAKPFEAYATQTDQCSPLKAVLKELEDVGNQKNASILLLLDSGRLGANWGLGVLRQTFTEELQNTANALKLKRLTIIHSCSPGEESWTSPELGGTVFGYFAARGLSGEAKSDWNANAVTLLDMQKYLQKQVAGWVKANRGRSQQPMVLGRSIEGQKDIRLAWVADALPEPTAPPLGKWDERLKAVAAEWQKYDKVSERHPWRHRPVAWSRYEHQLLGLQELIFTGDRNAVESLFGSLLSGVQLSASQFEADLEPAELRSVVLKARIARPTSVPTLEPPPAPPAPEEKDGEKPKSKKAEKPKAAPKPFASPEARLSAIRQLLWQNGDDRAATPDTLFNIGERNVFRESKDGLECWMSLLAGDSVDKATLEEVLKRWPADESVERRFAKLLLEWGDWEAPNREALAKTCLLAIRARHLAELAGSAEDIRARASIQTLIDTGDADRRLAEDGLLIGDAERLKKSEATLEELLARDGPYWRALLLGDQVSRAWRLRDEVFATLPWVMQWWSGSRIRAGIAESDLIDLQKALVALDRQLLNQRDFKDPRDLQSEVTALRNSWTKVNNDLLGPFIDTDLAERRTSYETAETVGEALLAIRMPRRGAQASGTRPREKILRELANRLKASASISSASARKSDKKTAPAFSDFAGWSRHPAMWLTRYVAEGLSIGKTERSRDVLVTEGADVRKAFQGLSRDLTAQVDRNDGQYRKSPENAPEPRQQQLQDDVLARAKAPLVGAGPLQIDREPGQLLRATSLADWYRWQARRALTDFWARERDQSPDDVPHFFAATAENFLSLADRQAPRGSELRRNITAALAEADKPALRGTPITVIRRRTGNQSLIQEDLKYERPGWPAGDLSFWVTRPVDGRPRVVPIRLTRQDSERRRAGLIPKAGGAFETFLSVEQLPGENTVGNIEILSLFRGHSWTDTVAVAQRSSPSLPMPLFPLPPPSIRVGGGINDKVNVLIVLDCSGSMNEPVEGEKPGTNRLDVAKAALTTILPRLKNDRFRVGFIAYGHRVTLANNMVVGPPGIRFANDVEVLVPVGADDAVNKIADLLKGNTLKPRGITPLYLSMTTALDELAKEEEKLPSQIVVLTDGLNNQVEQPINPAVIRSGNDVSRGLDGAPTVRISIVGFNLIAKPNEKDEEKTFNAWKAAELKKRRVTYNEATNLAQLRDRLLEASNLLQFQVREKDVVLETKPLSSVWASKDPAWRFERMHVVTLVRETTQDSFEKLVETTPFPLEGGEALDLRVLENPLRLAHPRWQALPGEHWERVKHGELLATFLRPVTAPEDPSLLRFRIALQKEEEEAFTPRPKSVWVEIRPMAQGAPVNDKVFVFAERRYEPGRPIPVHMCDLPKSLWPTRANAAEIKAWFRLEPPAEAAEEPVTLDELVSGSRVKAGDGVWLQQVSAVDDGENRRIVIQEQHDDRATVGMYKLSVDPDADRVDKATYEEQRIVEHALLFNRAALQGKTRFWLTSKDAITGNTEPAVPKNVPVDLR